MSDPVWYRSLYWRIGLGFVVLLAGLLAVQGFVSLWLTGRVAALIPGRSPAQFAEVVASQVSVALGDRPDLDLAAFMHERHAGAAHAWAVYLRDGRSAVSERVAPPPNAMRAARGRLASLTGEPRGEGPVPARGEGAGSAPPEARGNGRGGNRGLAQGRIGPALEFSTISVAGAPFGVVTVPSEAPPLAVALRGLGPTLAGVALVLLVLGTTLAALLVFRPAHRRLRALEQAARAFGSGDASARATEEGGDEVAALARTFNEMARDLTARSTALAESDRARRQVFADISHELATPLAAIRGYAETLAMPDVALDDETRRRYLGVIGDETERLTHIVGDLLDLAKLEGGGGAMRREPVAIRALFDRVEHRHEPVLRAKRITLRTSVEPADLMVQGDATRLEQALQNLAANAVRHTPDGGAITVTAGRDGGVIRLAVQDSGPGIPPEHLPRVFDRFYKADESRTGTSVPSGSGLGLSIVRAIIARHDGQVAATNGPTGGARFEVTLPA